MNAPVAIARAYFDSAEFVWHELFFLSLTL